MVFGFLDSLMFIYVETMKFKKDYESEKWEKMGLVPSTNDVVLQSDKEAKAVPKNIERGVVR